MLRAFLTALAELLGAALVIAGVASWSVPAALIVAGVALLFASRRWTL